MPNKPLILAGLAVAAFGALIWLGQAKHRLCPTFYTLCTLLILGPLSTNSAMSKERYLIA
jgi:hypothetical protein